MKKIIILPACDTFDSDAKPLTAGETYRVPEEISEADALICIKQGKAAELDENGEIIPPVEPPAAEGAEDDQTGDPEDSGEGQEEGGLQ